MNLSALFTDDDERQPLTAGSMLFREGEWGDCLYVILEGEVSIRSGDTELRTLGPGELLGEMALIDDAPRSADAVALTDCVVAPVDERRFLFLVHETPRFALHVMSTMARRLRD